MKHANTIRQTHGAANVNVNVNLHSLALTQLFPRVRMPELLRGHQEVTTDILH